MSTLTRFLQFSIPLCATLNLSLILSLLIESDDAFAEPACFSKNLYQTKSNKCGSKSKVKNGRLFSIYSNSFPERSENRKTAVKPFNQWNKNLSPTNYKLISKNRPLIITPDKYPNITLVSNGTDRHAITILSSTKIAMLASKTLSNPKLSALHIRCINNTTSVMFEFPSTKLKNATSSTEILYSIDNGPDNLLGLTLSQGDNILGLWSGKQAVPFTSKILGKNSLRINVWDAKKVEHTFTYDVSNLGHAIHNLRNACNW